MKKIILTSLFAICLIGNCFSQNMDTLMNGKVYGHPNHTPSGNHSLGPAFNYNMCGLNYVQSTVLIETRSQPWNFNTAGTGFPAPMTVAGLNPCDSIIAAYIWWIDTYTNACTTPVLSLTNPAAVTSNFNGVLVGSDGPKCWGEIGTYGFRADVTSAINGSGTY